MVPASLHAEAVNGMGPSSAQSILNTPIPYRYRCSCHLYNEENSCPAILNNCFGVTSNNTACAEGNCDKERTSLFVSIFPPSEVKQEESALAMDTDPPFATGHPTRCAEVINTRAMAAVAALVSG